MKQEDRVNFRFGEKRNVIIRVASCNRQPFEVFNAKYVLRAGFVVESSGECEIQQTDDSVVLLSVLVQPQAKNTTYTLEFTYEIPPEILKHVVKIGTF